MKTVPTKRWQKFACLSEENVWAKKFGGDLTPAVGSIVAGSFNAARPFFYSCQVSISANDASVEKIH
jgi:hypothetical protein